VRGVGVASEGRSPEGSNYDKRMMNTHQLVRRADSAATEIDFETAIVKLVTYCRANGWAGYDPYDALNSPIFRTLPFLDYRLPRLVFTQALKRSPVNFRRLLQIPKTQNPKAIALFLSAFLMRERVNVACQKSEIDILIECLRNLRSPGTDYWCWGYSFPWQTRTIVVPSGAPNLVCTSFVANALLNVFDHSGESRCLEMGLGAAEYILNELYWTEGSTAGFSYPVPSARGQVHNANFLAATLLCRAYAYTSEERFLVPALRMARYSAARQQPDGSWFYGETESQRWIDNFHTGYNLCALQAISRYAETTEFDSVLRSGFQFYRDHFFEKDGAVRYFHDKKYPIDIHCVAQSIITLVSLQEIDRSNLHLAQSVLQWALTHMWDVRGFFHYRILRACKIRTPYMRWSEAWMLLAMVTLLDALRSEGKKEFDGQLEGIAQRIHG
jgi:hypothetical protein